MAHDKGMALKISLFLLLYKTRPVKINKGNNNVIGNDVDFFIGQACKVAKPSERCIYYVENVIHYFFYFIKGSASSFLAKQFLKESLGSC